MPVLDGISATTEIRQIESRRRKDYEESPKSDVPRPRTSKILALTGMSSLEDKRRRLKLVSMASECSLPNLIRPILMLRKSC